MQSNKFLVFWHPDVLLHDTAKGVFEAAPSSLIEVPEHHPENSQRLLNMKSVLERGPLQGNLEWQDGRHATWNELRLVHDAAYIEHIRSLCEAGGGRLTSTTLVSTDSWKTATAAAGTAIAACEAVLSDRTSLAFALIRPPGHHAQPAQADGYCIFNNVALAAEHARRRGVDRVAIIDWDVHHGNGTQECFYRRPDVLTVSLHMHHGSWGLSHPQTGSPTEAGTGSGTGFNVNIELPAGCGDLGYGRAMEEVIAPVVEQYGPQLIIVAVGQDASQFDPNGRMLVTMEGFHALAGAARRLADKHCEGKLVAIQEGGYARTYAAYCLHATLEGLLREPRRLEDPLSYLPEDADRAAEAISVTHSTLSPYWQFDGVVR